MFFVHALQRLDRGTDDYSSSVVSNVTTFGHYSLAEQQANNDGFGCEVNRLAARRPESGERIVFTHDNLSTVCAGGF